MTNDRHLALATGAHELDITSLRFRQLLGRIDALLKKAVAVR